MNCPHCGAQLASDSRFCGACGRSMVKSSVSGEIGAGRGRPDAFRPEQTSPPESSLPRIVVTAPPDPYIGRMLGNRFKVEAKLGEGGFGAVYTGTQKGTGRKVALKLLHPDLAQDDNLVKRFQREGVILCGLRDAHTVTTYDFDHTDDGTLFIAMELLEGRSLHSVLAEEAPVRWDRMFRIVRQMCSSLAEAHEQGIVHRDLKPENIYLETRPGNPEFVKILDFGIAKVVQGDGGEQRTQLTATGQTLGTLEYMSPEQLMGKDLDGRSDVYAIGVLTYELITARLPFPDFKGPAGLITAQLRQIPDPPSAAYPHGAFPPEVDRVVLKMLEKDKANRYQDMHELRATCEELLAMVTQPPTAVGPDPGYPSTASTQPPREPVPGSAPGLAAASGSIPPGGGPAGGPPAPGGYAHGNQGHGSQGPGSHAPGSAASVPYASMNPGSVPPGALAAGNVAAGNIAPGSVAPGQLATPPPGSLQGYAGGPPVGGEMGPGAGAGAPGGAPQIGGGYGGAPIYPQAGYPPGQAYAHPAMAGAPPTGGGVKLWVWIALAVVAVGSAVGIAVVLAS